MSTPTINVGMTCYIGKGKTLWEVIEIKPATHTLELSALGKDGYSNRSAKVEEVTRLAEQTVVTSLAQVIEARAKAKNATANLADRLRFSDPKSIREATRKVNDLAYTYVGIVEDHHGDLAVLGIKAS